MNEHPALYDIARRITLEAGFDYTDPRTGVTTCAKKKKKSKKKLANPKPLRIVSSNER
jgi:hypothetical protein